MADQVSQITVTASDNVSAAMNAATSALNNTATAADNVTNSVTRAGKSAQTYVTQNDAVTASAVKLQKALSDQAAMASTFAAALASGSTNQDAFSRATDAMATKVATARANLAAAQASTVGLSGANTTAAQTLNVVASAHAAAANGANGFSLATAGATRELVVLGHEALTGNYSRIPGSLMVIAERMGGLETIIESVAGFVTSLAGAFTGVAAVAVYALIEMTDSGNTHLGMLAATQVALQGTQTNYIALGNTVLSVAEKVSQSSGSGLGLDAALAAAKQLASGQYFTGTAADLERLTLDAANVGAVMGGDATTGAKALAAAMQDPTTEANDLATTFSTTLTPELLRQVQLAQEAGDQNQAFTLILGALETAAQGAARNALSPLAKAWDDLGDAFSGGSNGWKPFFDWLATTAAAVLEKIASAVNALRDAFSSLGSTMSGLMNSGQPAPNQTSTGAVPTTSATQQAFINNWLDAAQQAGQQLGVSPQIMLAQWGLETGWGKSVYNNNAGNISGVGYDGPTYTNPGDGNTYRSYSSPQAFATDFANLIQGLPQYSGALNTGSNVQAYATAIKAGGYAQDPDYVSKLEAAYASLPTVSPTTGASNDPSMVNNAAALTNSMSALAAGTEAIKQQDLTDQLAKIKAAMDQLSAAGDTTSATYVGLSQANEKITADLYNNVDATTKAQRATESSLAASQGATAAEQQLSAALEARRQVELNAGASFTSADQQQVINNVLAEQSQAYDRVTDGISKTVAAQQIMTAAYDNGNQSVITATAQQSAYEEALKLFPQNTSKFTDAYHSLTEYYAELAESAAAAKVAQTNLQTQDSLNYIATETSSLGENTATRTQLLAVMQAEQEMHKEFGDVLPAEAQKYIDLKGAVADATVAYQTQQAALNELSGFFSSAFDTISSSITQAFANGTLQALKFSDVMNSVVASVISEFAKLAILNPISNELFGTNSVTLSSVGGVVGSLIGGTGLGSSTASTSGASAATSLASTSATGASSVLGDIGSLGTLAKGLSWLTGGSATSSLTSTLENAIGWTPGDSIGSYVSGLLGETSAGTVASTVGASAGETVPLAAADDAATAGLQTAPAVGAIGSAVNTVAEALPYLGAAVGIISSIAQGNYKSAGLELGGAAIGTLIAPGIGTAIGAALGGILGSFLPSHPENPYQNTQLNVSGGQLTVGTSVSQLENVDNSGLQNYVDGLNSYLAQVGVVLTNSDSTIGNIGDNIKGLAQSTDPNTFFNLLQFANNSADTSNFGVAKGALVGMQFSDPTDLSNEIAQIAGFADAASALGIQLASVGTNLTNIQIAGVTTGGAQTTTIQDASGNNVTYDSNLRTALQNDLPSQTFATVSDLDNELTKVNTFVTQTLPQLLTPTQTTDSTVQTQIVGVNQQYAAAISQDQQYGLGNTAALETAENQAIAILMKPSLDAIKTTLDGFIGTRDVDNYGQAGNSVSTMTNLQDSQLAAQSQLYDQIHQAFGDNQIATDNYNAALQQLLLTQQAETEATQRQVQAASDQSYASLTALEAQNAQGAGVDSLQTEMTALLAKQASDGDSFVAAWVDYYGQASLASAAFQQQQLVLTQANYAAQTALAQSFVDGQSITTRNSAGQAVTSLTSYAEGLETSSASPLSAQDQYSLTQGQFNTDASAAAGGSYTAIQAIQADATAFLAASRNLNGSGAQYTTDFNSVLAALANIGNTGADALTASYMASIAQQQTDQLVAELQDLKAAVVALQLTTQQAASAPARVS